MMNYPYLPLRCWCNEGFRTVWICFTWLWIVSNFAQADFIRWDSRNKHARLKIELGSFVNPMRNARAILYRLVENEERYVPVWQELLPNTNGPDEVLLTEDGHFVVTLDDRRSFGYGPNVVVIYGQEASIIAKYALEDLLDPQEIQRIPQMQAIHAEGNCSSSRLWRRKWYLDETRSQLVLVMNIAPEGNDEVIIRIDLATGKIALKRTEPESHPIQVPLPK